MARALSFLNACLRTVAWALRGGVIGFPLALSCDKTASACLEEPMRRNLSLS